MPVLATLVADPAKAPLSDARLDEVAQGANDLAMLEAAGPGVACRAKRKVAAAAHACRHGDLTALLFGQGIARKKFVRGLREMLRAKP
jgi:phosphoserine phosphatase